MWEREDDKKDKKTQPRKMARHRLTALRQQKTRIWPHRFSLRLKHHDCGNVTKTKTGETRRGPPGSTIIILKEIIRFNNNHLTRGSPRFLPTRGSCRRGVLPPLRGGNSWTKESPVLPIPSYPALCREDTTSWNDGRPRTHHRARDTCKCV